MKYFHRVIEDKIKDYLKIFPVVGITGPRQSGKSTTLYLHRFLLDPSPNKDVHHRDENPLNNLEENLEVHDAIVHRNWHNRNRLFKDVTRPLCYK